MQETSTSGDGISFQVMWSELSTRADGDEVRSYLEQVDYSNDPDYTRSEVSKYSCSDKPNPVKLSWEGKASFIQVSTSPDLSDSWGKHPKNCIL